MYCEGVSGLPPHTTVAVNTATDSTNKIHDDAVAASLGFTSGLVPGVVTLEYLCRPALSEWGTDWLERGAISARFVRPVFAGQELTITSGEIERNTDGLEAELTCRVYGPLTSGLESPADCPVVATATVSLADAAPEAPEVRYGRVPVSNPALRPPACRAAFAALNQLGTIERRFSISDSMQYMSTLGGNPGAYRRLGVAPPGDLIRDSNWILEANVELGPWIHAATNAVFYSPVTDDDLISTRGKVVDAYERNGHEYAVMDLQVVLNDWTVAMTVEHIVIWQPAPVLAAS